MMAIVANKEEEVFRPLANFPPTLWGYSFAKFSFLDPEFESYTKGVEVLKQEVIHMLMQSTEKLADKIEFINLLCRLGVSYHFENEIEKQLNDIFIVLPDLLSKNDYDLYTLAILFQVLRQYGYKMPCDVFNKFKDSDGGFKKTISSDVKGLLSLYEATFLSVHGEDILDEALAFTRQHLETLAAQSSPRLAKRIRNALLRPFHQGIERLEARQYICFYEGDESRNETLLKFAKFDYNRLQFFYKQELALLSSWWKDINLAEKLPYIRDRIVEVYLWAVAAHFEPEYTLARLMITKYTKMLSVVDDTYDAYGTIDELRRFTDAFQRCNADAIDEVPEYMKVIYKGLLNLFDETESAGNEEMSSRTSYAKEKFKEIARGYFVEAKWFNEGYVPSMEEYIENGLITSTYSVIPAASFIGMENVMGTKEYEWVENNPKTVIACKLICRLMDDITTREDERKRGHCASSVECYMKEHGVSEMEAIAEIQRMCANAWKDMNAECMKPTAVPRVLLKYYLNLARVIDFVYKYMDSYTYCSSLKEDVYSLFLGPLPM
ncbi:probable terpene synthase 6 [Hevea brasiliensis]|nr:probable terpene synthase 6 [Hevea brasiliensis]